MARKHETRTIEGLEVTVQKFRPTRAYHVVAFALKTLGPVLGAVVPTIAAGGLGALLRMSTNELGAALGQLDVAAADALMLELLRETAVIGDRAGKRVQYDLSRGKDEIDEAFDEAGFPALLSAMKFSIEVNFAGFTKSAAALGGAAAAPAQGAATPST